MPERDREKEQKVTPQQLVVEITSLIHSTVPDRYPKKESRVGVDKVEDYFSTVYSPVDPNGEMLPVRVDRDVYPRIDSINEAKLVDSLLDKSYAIWIGDSKPYFLREAGLMFDGVKCSDEQLSEMSSSIQALKKGVEDGSVEVSPHKYDNDINSKTLGRIIPIFESS